MRGFLLYLAALALWCSNIACSYASDAVADFYRGKQITLILSTGPGGGYDLYGRPLAVYLGRHIPGNPTVTMQYMEGGGGIRAMNYLANVAARDGTVIALVHNTVAFAPLFGVTQTKFDATQFNWLGSMNDEGSVCITWRSAAVKNFNDLFSKQMIAGSTGPGSDMEIYALAMNRLAGTKIKIINGYKGANDIYLAMEKGEVDGRCGTAISGIRASRPDWIANHLVQAVVQTSIEPGTDPFLSGVPLIIDKAKNADQRSAWELLFAPQKMARPVLAPPGAPADRIQALRTALKETLRDPAFVSEMEASKSAIHYLSGEDLQRYVKRMYSVPDSVRKLAVNAIRSAD